MMIVKMDKMSPPSSRELAQHLYDKNIELENRRRRSAQARIPSDPNAWQQMRENYEALILEDHAFSEQHNIEYALWQLHYRRIEEFRAHFSSALASAGPNTLQGGRGPPRPDRITKIRLQFRTFLSEATGFYHDLVVKIRARYGLPLGYFPEDSEHHAVAGKSGQKSAEVKKGLISCHRCMIYLGDLARYKGQYAEGESKTRDFAAASSYYLQAASLWPSSGNPHHQLAILASYSGDELAAVYRYFRSLAVDSPFSTARDNLIVAFEKNRQSYSQLPVEAKGSASKELRMGTTGKGRGKGEPKLPFKNSNAETSIGNDPLDTSKIFCIRFVRLNGILFTRTSLETFAEVLSLVNSGLLELLSSGDEEKLNFGVDTAENQLVILRLITILIFTVHNVNKQAEGQTYAEILQRNVLLQNAFAAVFGFMANILNRCAQLRDPSSSFLLPGILVFLEWLACCPDIAAGNDADEKQAAVRSIFGNHYVSFLNKLLSIGLVSMDDEGDETCFFNMSSYEEGDTENRIALWEDFELRGFLPLLPAQAVLDFSRKHISASDGNKEIKARVTRVLAAGKALANMVKVGQETIYFDSKMKKFVIGIEPQKSDNYTVDSAFGMSQLNGVLKEIPSEKFMNPGTLQPSAQLYMEGEEEDEVIVFKPAVSEKLTDIANHNLTANGGLETRQNPSLGNSPCYGLDPLHVHQHTALSSSLQPPLSLASFIPQHLPQQQQTLVNGLKGINTVQSAQARKPDVQRSMGFLDAVSLPLSIQQPVNTNINSISYGQDKSPEIVVAVSSGVKADSFVVNASSIPPTSKGAVSRPVRHIGPPPGFSRMPGKQLDECMSGPDVISENALMDDYSWLDGYQLPESLKGSGLRESIDHLSGANSKFVTKNNGITDMIGFPFPGKQVPRMPFQVDKQVVQQDSPLEHLKLYHERQIQHPQPAARGNQQFPSEQYQGPSVRTGHYFV